MRHLIFHYDCISRDNFPMDVLSLSNMNA